MKEDLPDKAQIAHEILAYLTDHPEAEDTLEGIVEWWLLDRRIRYQTERVKQALSELVEKGLILEQRANDSRVHYRTNQSRCGEIRTLVKQMKGG